MDPLTLALIFGAGLLVRAISDDRKRPIRMSLTPRPSRHTNTRKVSIKPPDRASPGLVVHKGVPHHLAPAGYTFTDVWVRDGAKYYPEPRRFKSFHEWRDAGEGGSWLAAHTVAAEVGGSLSWYVPARRVAAGECCEVVRCVRPSRPGWGFRTGLGGTPGGHAKTQDAICRCETEMGECFETALPLQG